MYYKAIEGLNREKSYSIARIASVLGINPSSYYKYKKRLISKQERINLDLVQVILMYKDKYKGILGYRRMTSWINKDFHKQYNEKRIRRIMRGLNIQSMIRRKRKAFVSCVPIITANNILKRKFKANKPNQKWLTDVTEFKILGIKEKLYLSAILDIYDKSIVSYETSLSNDNNLAHSTLDKAIKKNPNVRALLHSDRGSAYTSLSYKEKLDSYEITQSMSRPGYCIDNGPMEGFWGIIKSEMYYNNKFHSIEKLKDYIDDYIYFYNYQRYHGGIKNKIPMQYRICHNF